MIGNWSTLAMTGAMLALFPEPSYAQNPQESEGEETEQGQEEGATAYYVVDDPSGAWNPDAMDEDEAEPFGEDESQSDAEEPGNEEDSDTEMSSEEDGELPGVREPPGLPLLAAVEQDADQDGSEDPPPFGAFGGTQVADAAAPWQAQIYYPGIGRNKEWTSKLKAGVQPWVLQHYCGGALIAPDWVVTAAHCIDEGMMQAGYRIRLGAERIDGKSGWTYKINRVIRHPRYLPMRGGDIALIQIVNDQGHRPPVSQVRRIGIFKGADATLREKVTAFGWGRTGNAGAAANAIMLQVNLNIIDRSTCANRISTTVDNRVVCAAAAGRKTCSNDSGGPLINASRELVGIVSAGGRSCADDGVPGVYTRIAYYLPWITQQTGGAVRSHRPNQLYQLPGPTLVPPVCSAPSAGAAAAPSAAGAAAAASPSAGAAAASAAGAAAASAGAAASSVASGAAASSSAAGWQAARTRLAATAVEAIINLRMVLTPLLGWSLKLVEPQRT